MAKRLYMTPIDECVPSGWMAGMRLCVPDRGDGAGTDSYGVGVWMGCQTAAYGCR